MPRKRVSVEKYQNNISGEGEKEQRNIVIEIRVMLWGLTYRQTRNSVFKLSPFHFLYVYSLVTAFVLKLVTPEENLVAEIFSFKLKPERIFIMNIYVVSELECKLFFFFHFRIVCHSELAHR